MQQIDERGDCDEDQPEPDEQEDLLIEQVDRQHTLDRVEKPTPPTLCVLVRAVISDHVLSTHTDRQTDRPRTQPSPHPAHTHTGPCISERCPAGGSGSRRASRAETAPTGASPDRR